MPITDYDPTPVGSFVAPQGFEPQELDPGMVGARLEVPVGGVQEISTAAQRRRWQEHPKPKSVLGAIGEGISEGWGPEEPGRYSGSTLLFPFELAARAAGAGISGVTSGATTALQHGGMSRTAAEQLRRDLNLGATDFPTGGLAAEAAAGARAGIAGLRPIVSPLASDVEGSLRIGGEIPGAERTPTSGTGEPVQPATGELVQPARTEEALRSEYEALRDQASELGKSGGDQAAVQARMQRLREEMGEAPGRPPIEPARETPPQPPPAAAIEEPAPPVEAPAVEEPAQINRETLRPDPGEPVEGEHERVSTRRFTAEEAAAAGYDKVKDAEAAGLHHMSPDYVVGYDAAQGLPSHANHAQRIKDKTDWVLRDEDGQPILDAKGRQQPAEAYPGVPVGHATEPEAIHRRFIGHMVDNLLWLYDHPDVAPWRERAKLWYVGANKIARDWATEYGHPPRAIAAALAHLSPQRDWFMNVSMAQRALDIWKHHQDTMFTPAMREHVEGKIVQYLDDYKKGRKPKDLQDAMDYMDRLDRIGDSKFGQLKGRDRAWWARWFDEAHNDPHFHEVTPEGGFGRQVLNVPDEKTGIQVPTTRTWGPADQLENVFSSLENPTVRNISKNLGEEHKVRNFYNNIRSPFARFGDVTIDTHAIAAALLRGLGGSTAEVDRGLDGLYPYYAEAYRQAADRRGILPREMQSVTWEALRALFSPEAKRNRVMTENVNRVWKGVTDGTHTADQARQLIYELAREAKRSERNPQPRGIDAPGWHGFDDQGAYGP